MHGSRLWGRKIGRVRWRRKMKASTPGVRNVLAGDPSGPVVQAGSIRELHVHVPQVMATIPRGLEGASRRLVNREAELEVLDLIGEEATGAAGPIIVVLSGMHGVGKTAVGNHWSHLNRARFSGGDLYGDFSKRTHNGIVDVSDVLEGFLRDLGTADSAIPSSFSERQRAFRALTAERKLLVLLDDVDQPAQVLDVLPAGAGSVVIVTSNYHLDELLADGAEYLPLKPLERDACVELVTKMIGPERVGGESQASIDALIKLCGGLPVVLCVCAGRLVKHREKNVKWVLEEVAGQKRKVRALSGPGAFAAEATFDFAYSDLEPSAGLMYRRLGIHPGHDLGSAAAATLAECTVAEAEELLEGLFDAHMLESRSLGRYGFHTLVADHAAGCAERDDDESEREAAMRRLVDWYCTSVRNADRAIVRERLRLIDDDAVASADASEFASASEALAWFETERANLMAVIHGAADRGWDWQVWLIAEALWPLVYNHRYFTEWIDSHELGIEAALRMKDPVAEARLRSQLGRARAEQGEHERASEEIARAQAAAALGGTDMLKASVEECAGMCLLSAGEARASVEAFARAREMFVACSSVRGTAIQDYHLGKALLTLGEFQRALDPLAKAADALAGGEDDITVGRVLLRRAEALLALGEPNRAEGALRSVVEIMSGRGIWLEHGEALVLLAQIAERAQEPEVARGHRQDAYRIYKQHGDARSEALLASISVASSTELTGPPTSTA
jgi:tetratricopeptide (TPR) repeat protein